MFLVIFLLWGLKLSVQFCRDLRLPELAVPTPLSVQAEMLCPEAAGLSRSTSGMTASASMYAVEGGEKGGTTFCWNAS